jgi:hypothetical protein
MVCLQARARELGDDVYTRTRWVGAGIRQRTNYPSSTADVAEYSTHDVAEYSTLLILLSIQAPDVAIYSSRACMWHLLKFLLIAMTPSTNHSLWLTNSHPHPHPRTTTTRAERALSSQFLRVSQFSMDTVVFCYNTGVLRAQYWSIVDLNTEVLAHTYS